MKSSLTRWSTAAVVLAGSAVFCPAAFAATTQPSSPVVVATQPAGVDALVAQLSSPDVNVRVGAENQLIKMGQPAKDALSKLIDSQGAALKYRAQRLIRRINGKTIPTDDGTGGGKTITVTTINGAKTVNGQLGSVSVRVRDNADGIKMTIEGADDNDSESYLAKSPDELQTEFPDAFDVYQQVIGDPNQNAGIALNGGMLQINNAGGAMVANGVMIQIQNGQANAINGPIQPDASPTAPLNRDLPKDTVGEVQRYVGHTDAVNSVVITSDFKCVISAGDDHTLKIWDTRSGKLLQSLDANPAGISTVALSPDGKQILTAGKDGSILLFSFDGTTATLSGKLPSGSDAVLAAAFSPDSSKILTGGDDQTYHLWDAKTDTLIFEQKIPSASVSSLAFSPDGKSAAIGDDNQTIHLVDLDKHAESGLLKGSGARINTLAFSPDGTKLASGSGSYSPTQNTYQDCSVRIWDLGTMKQLGQLTGFPSEVTGLVYTPDGNRILTCGNDKLIRIWDAATDKLINALDGNSAEVDGIAVSKDGQYAASAGADKTVRLWGLPK